VDYFYIYNSERFLSFAEKHLEIAISKESIQAAKDVSQVLLEESDPILTAKNSPGDIVEEIIDELVFELIDADDKVTGRIAETNASSWGLDTHEILYVDYDDQLKEIEFSAYLYLAGEQDPDRFRYGDKMEVEISGTLKYTGDSFQVKNYAIQKCEINLP
jgi:hypothetical protein